MHIKILERIEVVDKNHDATLQSILEVDEKVKRIVEDRDKHHKNYDKINSNYKKFKSNNIVIH